MGRRPMLGNEHDDEIERLYVKEKLSMSAIAKKYGVKTMTIKRKLMKRGVDIRGISSAMSLHHIKKARSNRTEDTGSGRMKATGDIQNDDDLFSGDGSNEDWLD